MQGRRVDPDLSPTDYQPGDYALRFDEPEGRQLWFRDPIGNIGRCVKHAITEHEDGTITVSPSILVERGSRGSWHGFLERGIWRTV